VRATRADYTGSIPRVLPVAFYSPTELFLGAGGFAAAIAIGAFFGQVISVLKSDSDERRTRRIAEVGLAGLIVITGLILVSMIAR
jgi:hypothetical protein